jgi:hypothetical protein
MAESGPVVRALASISTPAIGWARGVQGWWWRDGTDDDGHAETQQQGESEGDSKTPDDPTIHFISLSHGGLGLDSLVYAFTVCNGFGEISLVSLGGL